MNQRVEWAELKMTASRDEHEKNLQALPRLHIYQTNRNVKCKICEFSNHKWITQYAECKVDGCLVLYKIVSCDFASKWQINNKNEHNHNQENIAKRGIAQPFKDIIND